MTSQLSCMMLSALVSVFFAVILLASTSQFAWTQSPETNISSAAVFLPNSQPYGLSYGEWTAKWWQWALSVPTENNPLYDETGEDCTQAQNQTSPVWFLAGTFGGSVERKCTIPAGKAILFPVVNNVNVRAASETDEELLAGAKNPVDSATTLEASIDGTPLQDLWSYRIQSPFFDVTIPNDNVFGASGGTYRAVADGYWVFLEPLPPGQHEIRFHGVMGNPTAASIVNLETAVTYHLTISNSTTSSM
jgi:hypothetical protein